MEPRSTLNIETSGAGRWIVTLDTFVSDGQRMLITLPMHADPSPTIGQLELKVLAAARDLIDARTQGLLQRAGSAPSQ